MTTREFLTNVKSMADYLGFHEIDTEHEGYTPQEMYLKAGELIAALDAKNAKRKSADSKEKRESKARRDAVVAFLLANDGDHSRDEIAVACDMTEGQATAACTALIKDGVIHKATIKVDKATKVVYGINAE